VKEEIEKHIHDRAKRAQSAGNKPIGHRLKILIDLMHVVFRNADNDPDSLSLVEIEYG